MGPRVFPRTSARATGWACPFRLADGPEFTFTACVREGRALRRPRPFPPATIEG
ncbi:hypothetical protein ACFCZ1_21405 [Streptomyces sp. NPDC056224]|uniref:hypothetical protein n=1 Tax=Streptomyces sp. NPDC056224 TaxID=3345750 RepID=UPI0035D7196D